MLQHLPFQSMNSNTKEVCERCSRLIKKTLVRQKSIVLIDFVRFEQTLHLARAFMAVFQKQLNVQFCTGSISVLISLPIHNAANQAIAKNS